MKIAVYTIAKNEEQFIERWYESAKDADYILIADTGSTDDTVVCAEHLGVSVLSTHISPWRFDDARNAALAALPADIDMCIALDMDEVLVSGWREKLESVDASCTRPRYKYVWSWNDDGSEGLVYGGDKIHSRSNYRWKHPVHETLTSVFEKQEWCDLEIHHHPDSSKSRSQYFGLLELAKQESPNCDRTAFYYGRELFFHNRFDEAAEEFKRHLNLPSAVWKPERSASMRYLAKCGVDSEYWFLRACAEYPEGREPWVELAKHYYSIGLWSKVVWAVEFALTIINKPMDYLCESDAWSWLPYDLMAIAKYNLGNKKEALHYGNLAVTCNPNDVRLQNNLVHYEI